MPLSQIPFNLYYREVKNLPGCTNRPFRAPPGFGALFSVDGASPITLSRDQSMLRMSKQFLEACNNNKKILIILWNIKYEPNVREGGPGTTR